jgi:hypothetical protein
MVFVLYLHPLRLAGAIAEGVNETAQVLWLFHGTIFHYVKEILAFPVIVFEPVKAAVMHNGPDNVCAIELTHDFQQLVAIVVA